MRIAIMQPYFLPYAGYFRLFQHTDLFVIYDCVQFIRRGWIHRNQLYNNEGKLSWLTLPLVKATRDIRISDLSFPDDAEIRLQDQLNKFPIFHTQSYKESELRSLLIPPRNNPVNYISNLLKKICEILEIPFNVVYSSQLNLRAELKAQEKIISIAKQLHATTYINSPGGKQLYDNVIFKQHNLKLEFLNDYNGSYESILPRLFKENISELKNEIKFQ